VRQRNGEGVGVERIAYSPQEFAVAAGLGRSMVYELIRRGEVPHIRIGRRIVIPREMAETWLKRMAVEGGTQ